MIVTLAWPPPSHMGPVLAGPLAPFGPRGLTGFGCLRRTPSGGCGVGAVRPLWRSEPLDDRDVGLAAALAHCLEAVAAAGALQLVEESGHELDAGRAQRV